MSTLAIPREPAGADARFRPAKSSTKPKSRQHSCDATFEASLAGANPLTFEDALAALTAAALAKEAVASDPALPSIPSCASMPVLPPSWAASPLAKATAPSAKSQSQSSSFRSAFPPSLALPPPRLPGSLSLPPALPPSFFASLVDACSASASSARRPSLKAKQPLPADLLSSDSDGVSSESESEATFEHGDARGLATPKLQPTPDAAATPLSHATLARAFDECVATSALAAADADRLIAYDAADCADVRACGRFKVRLDARRNKKPNPQAAALAADPSTDPNALVDAMAPVDAAKFNFTKVSPKEVLLRGLALGHEASSASPDEPEPAPTACRAFNVLPNKFPIGRRHLLLVDAELSPQRLSRRAVEAVAELLTQCRPFAASFNSWGAAASIGHLHVHLLDEALPVDSFELHPLPAANGSQAAPGCAFALSGYPATHLAFRWTDAAGRAALCAQLDGCHAAGVPYNVAFSALGFAVVFPRAKAQSEFAWQTYGERLGGFEMCGIFTAYEPQTYAALSEDSIARMLALATVPMPQPVGC